jgi:predicted RNase H-like HicB family nuclease
VTIHPVEDQGEKYFFAYLPDFGASACSACGDTIIEALDTLELVANEVIELLAEIPTDHEIERIGLEARKQEIDKVLAAQDCKSELLESFLIESPFCRFFSK